MPQRKNPDRQQIDRVAALCRELDKAISVAASARTSSARALDALHQAKEAADQLCGEVTRLASSSSATATPPLESRRASRKNP